jgi:hypothetical protein
MDDFTIYGTDASRVTRMSDGLWAQVGNVTLAADPDPSAGGSYVLEFFTSGTPIVRRVLSSAQTTVGVAARYWLNSLPAAANAAPQLVSVRDASNVIHGWVSVNPSGYLEYYRNDSAGAVLVGQSNSPVVVTNAWRHIESKIVLDTGTSGSVVVRLEGVQQLSVTGIRTTRDTGAVASCSSVAIQNGIGTSATGMYVKDLICWDGSGSSNNNFVGSCQVYKITPSSDASLNWTPSTGTTGYNLINGTTPDDDSGYISATSPAPSPATFNMSDLPANVTSVKGVMAITRSRKTDGGDGQLQVSLVSGASTGDGSNRTITTAYTYWTDLWETDPQGGGVWTKARVDALVLKLNRTV